MIGALDDLDVHALENSAQRVVEARTLISAIGVELQEKRIEAEQRGHQEHTAVAILDIGGMHDGVHQEALRVDENVSFLALDLLACIVAMRIDARPPFSVLFTLWLSMIATVGEASRAALSAFDIEHVMDAVERAVPAPTDRDNRQLKSKFLRPEVPSDHVRNIKR